MTDSEAIINPVKGKTSPNPGSRAILVATRGDLSFLCRSLDITKHRFADFYISRLYIQKETESDYALVGPLIGAPYMAMIVDTLITWGVKKIMYFGWCGAISPSLKIGDILVPTSAFIDEGTSRNYNSLNAETVRPDTALRKTIEQALGDSELTYHTGSIWSTDAIFRETKEKVQFYQNKKGLAVDMETSALFSVGRFRHIPVCAIHAVSDELSDYRWRPGFSNPLFKESREAICGLLKTYIEG